MVDFNEFINMMGDSNDRALIEEEARQAFSFFDMNGDGYITRKELKKMMNNVGQKVSKKEISKMMKSADTDGDGKINFEGILLHFFVLYGILHPEGHFSIKVTGPRGQTLRFLPRAVQ